MTVLPTVQVLLDDGSGTFPFDVTSSVRMPDGITWSRGRPDEFQAVSPGSLSLTFDNAAGGFTYLVPPIAPSPDQKIRLLVNSRSRFTGRVQSWPVGWPGGGETFSTVQVTAVDDLARCARRVLRSSCEEEQLVDIPSAMYPLSEGQGATLAGDTSGNGAPSLAITGSGSPLVFGSGTGPTDGLSCVTFAGGTFLRNALGKVYIPAGSALTLECYFATTMTPSFASFMTSVAASTGSLLPDVGLAINPAGRLAGTAGLTVSSPAAVNDGLVHHAMLTVTFGGTATLYLDGVSVASSAGATLPTSDLTVFSVAASDNAAISTPYVGTVAHAAAYPGALSGARATSHAGATDDFEGESPTARITRICGYVGVPVGTLDTTGNTVMGAASQGGRNALDVLNETADATLGIVYMNGSGQVVNVTGYTFSSSSMVSSTLDALWAAEDTSVEVDLEGTINQVTGGRPQSENTFTYQNKPYIGVHGVYPEDFTWNVNTDAQVVDRTTWIAQVYARESPRFPTLSVDVLSMGATDRTAALTLDVGTFLHMPNLPSQTPNGAIADIIVNGITEAISLSDWTISINGPGATVRHFAWVLEDGFWGKLDNTTRLFGA